MSSEKPKTGLELFSAVAPSGYRATILLEELGLPYELTNVDLNTAEHLQPEFTQNVNPIQLIPVLVDHDEGGLRVAESGAVMTYLLDCKAPAAGGEAARIAAELLPPPSDPRRRGAVLSQLFWQNSTFYAAARRFFLPLIRGAPFTAETVRYNAEGLREQMALLEAQLQKTGSYVATDRFTVADIATLPYAMGTAVVLGIDLEAEMPAVHAWIQRLLERPAVRRGLHLPAPYPPLMPGPEGEAGVEGLRRKLVEMGLEDLNVGAPRIVLPDAE